MRYLSYEFGMDGSWSNRTGFDPSRISTFARIAHLCPPADPEDLEVVRFQLEREDGTIERYGVRLADLTRVDAKLGSEIEDVYQPKTLRKWIDIPDPAEGNEGQV